MKICSTSLIVQFNSVQSLSRARLFVTLWTVTYNASLSILPTPRTCSNSCPSSRWCHPTISSSVIPVSSCLQFFLASRSFPVSQFFSSGNQNIGVSTSSSVLPMNIQGCFSLILIGLILQSKVLSRVFFSTTVRRHVFFTTQPFLWFYGSHIHTWLLEKP